MSSGLSARRVLAATAVSPTFAQSPYQFARSLFGSGNDEFSRSVRQAPHVPEQYAEDLLILKVIDDALVEFLHPVLDGLHVTVDLADSLVAQIEQIRIEER